MQGRRLLSELNKNAVMLSYLSGVTNLIKAKAWRAGLGTAMVQK